MCAHLKADPHTVLHPRHKLDYFKNAQWSREWIDTAEGLVRKRYESRYANRFVAGGEKTVPVVPSTAKVCRSRLFIVTH